MLIDRTEESLLMLIIYKDCSDGKMDTVILFGVMFDTGKGSDSKFFFFSTA